MLKASSYVILRWAVSDRQVMPTAKAMPERIGPDYAIAGSWMRPCIGGSDIGWYIPEVLDEHIFVKMLEVICIVSI